ncbi:MAG: molybdopterin oxidoreductase family protein [Pseudomonadales bacterium]|nr:molybdopterin oxidoreductase family protein [Pseudomonadales bacterium]
MTDIKTHYRACNLCEAICGLEIKTQNNKIISIKGDKQDPLSRGFICAKGTALQDIQEDSNRLRQPMKRIGDQWEAVEWDVAFEWVANKIVETQSQHNRDAVGVYLGNPNVHNYGSLTHGAPFCRMLSTKNQFSATSLDQLPLQMACYFLYGHQFLIPIPDIDHCDYFLMIGANPMVSNGSLWTVPDFPARLKALQGRGGELVVVDPRRTETAKVANEHYFVRPGSDAFLLMAIIHTLFDEEAIVTGHLDSYLPNLDGFAAQVQDFSPEAVSELTGIEAQAIREMARKLSSTERAICYGRTGISIQKYGALSNWAIQVINILCGNLDVEGGTLVTHPAVGLVKPGEAGKGGFARKYSRVSSLPSFSGELPATVMAEEMLTPGDGQIKGFISVAGNPVLSSPNGARLDAALENLDFMVSIDFYINETTRHADIILPPTSTLEHDHYDIAFLRFATRNTVRFNEEVIAAEGDAKHDWQIFNELMARIAEKTKQPFQPLPEPSLMMDLGLRTGYYSQEPGNIGELSLKRLKDNPHGIDLGPLKPSLTERLCTKDGLIDLAPEVYMQDLGRLRAELNDSILEPTEQSHLSLIGRRHIRSNNSWLHNSHRLVKGKPRWQLFMHPKDMEERSLVDGSQVTIQSAVNAVETQVLASEDMMRGVVSLPHGWGHRRKGVKLDVASQQEGVSVNDVTDDHYYDELSGNAAFNGVPVEVTASGK